MQSQTLTKPTAKRGMQPGMLLQKDWQPIVPMAVLPPQEGYDLDTARLALNNAQRVIHAQEERIRQLENLALTDELTGLLNRRGFTLALERELSFARRDSSARGVLVMIDLDGFKSINDLWGHSAGDDYLQAVAHALLGSVRMNDVVARLGGDEFAILFTRMDEEAGMRRMDKLEKSFNSRMMQWNDKTLPLRASFGLSAYTGMDTPDAIIEAADLKLYAHKSRRNSLSRVG
jgi:diguanylate cyclase (GGDEF)-like protein